MNAQNKPVLHPESNVNGQQINFEADDFQSNNLLQMHFLQSSAQKQQKYYYEQEDGEVESKITTASPSKTQYYKQKDEFGNITGENQNNPRFKGAQGMSDFSPHNKQPQQNFSQSAQHPEHTLVASMTEKKLNNYLQQAKYLMNNQQQQINPPQLEKPHKVTKQAVLSNQKGKNYSVDTGSAFNATEIMHHSNVSGFHQQQVSQQLPMHLQNIYQLDSCASTKMLFTNNAYEDYKDPIVEADSITLKSSFNSASKRADQGKRLTQQHVNRKSYTDKKGLASRMTANNKKPELTNLKNAINKESLSNFQSHRNSEFSRAQTQQKLVSKLKTDSIKKKGKKTFPNQIIDQLDNIIIDDDHDDQVQHSESQYQGLKVLDYDDDQQHQVDLGAIQSVNKRQTSKTEVFSPIGHRKKASAALPMNKQPFLQQQVSTKSNISRTSAIGGSHKKTISHMQMMQDNVGSNTSTRNNVLRSRHMTTTTSPAYVDRVVDQKSVRQRLSSGKKPAKDQISLQNRTGTQTLPSPFKKTLNHNTMEIQEDQNEDEDYKHHHQTQQPPHFQLQQREFDIINQTISPSSSSKFQFQPKFFKPTNTPHSPGLQSQSMEEPKLQMSNILSQQNLLAKDSKLQEL